MAIPQLTEQSVASTPLPTPLNGSNASPDEFGAGIARAVQGGGQELAQAGIEKRKMDAAFASADVELKYGEDLDATVAQYKNDLKGLQTENSGDFSDAVKALQAKYLPEIEALRQKHQGALTDPLALKNFDLKTRIQTQAAARHMLVAGDERIDKWKDTVADGSIDAFVNQAGRVSGNAEVDALNIEAAAKTKLGIATARWQERGESLELIQKKVRLLEEKGVLAALAAYGNEGYAQGTALLNSKIGGVRVGFDQKNPTQDSVLDGPTTQKFLDSWSEVKDKKTGDSLGAQWYLLDKVSEGNLKDVARKAIADGRATPGEAAAAILKFRSLRSGDYVAQEHARTVATQVGVQAVVKYGGVEEAQAAGAIPPGADTLTLLGAETRTEGYADKVQARAVRPLLTRLGAVISDPSSAGWSKAITLDNFTDRLLAQGVPATQIKEYQRAYHKDFMAADMQAKTPSVSHFASEIQQYAMGAVGLTKESGKNLTSAGKQWQRDVIAKTELEFYQRVQAAGKDLKPTDIPSIVKEVSGQIEEWKQQARAGTLVLPTFKPTHDPNSATDTQKAAAAKMLGIFSSSSQIAAASAAGQIADGPVIPTRIVIKDPDPRIPGSKPGEEYEPVPGGYKRVK